MFRFLHWRSLLQRKHFEREMAEEFAFHKDARIEDLMRRGLPFEEAARRARLEFGGTQRYGEECREAHRLHFLDEMRHDVRYGWRSMRKNPSFAASAIVSLALGIGMNSIVFSVCDSLLLKPLPVAAPEKLVFVQGNHGVTHSFPDYLEFRESAATFRGLAAYRISPMNLQYGGDPQRVWGYLATGNYFDLLGVKPALGRFFHQHDDMREGGSPYAVLSYSAWQKRFGSDRSIAGKLVRLDGLKYTVLGVAPPGFHGTELFYWPEVWVPMMMQPQIEGHSWLNNRNTFNSMVIGRLKPDVTRALAAADLNRIADRLSHKFPNSDKGLRIKLVEPGLMGSAGRDPVSVFLWTLLILVMLVLLTACLNLAGLMLARSSDRQREMAIRSSIGAGTGRIVRQVLTESSLLSLLGGGFGLAIALVTCRLLSQWQAPIDFPAQFEVRPDWRVFVFTATVSLAAGILFSIGPALHLSRSDLNTLLKGATSLAVPKSRFRFALRDLLVCAEVALCFVLVFGSLLSVRGLQNALKLPLGFDPDAITTAAFDLGLSAFNEDRGRVFQARILEKVKALPGTIAVAYANSTPLSIDQSTTGVHAEDETKERSGSALYYARSAVYYQVSPGFLVTLRVPLLTGRDFNQHDDSRAPRVAIINQAFANQVMHTNDPVGKAFRWGPGAGERVKVIGLVKDGKYSSLTETPTPAIFESAYQEYNPTTVLVIRSRRPSPEIVRDVQRLIKSANGQLPVYGTGTLESMLGFVLFPMHAAAIALSAFGLLALMLAITGIHGLVTYAVARRTREIGIRIAIGAQPVAVLQSLLARMMTLVMCGLAIGFLLALVSGQALTAVVYGISPRDPALLLTVLLCFLLVTVLSCLAPARRALRINPVNAIRYE